MTRPARRNGMTLIELLVVFAIIAILGALLAAGIMSWLSSQNRRNTDAALKAINEAVRQQWQAVIDEASKEPITSADYQNPFTPPSASFIYPKSIMDFADKDPERARAIWIKLRLMERFPVNFHEIDHAYQLDWTDKVNNPPNPLIYIPPNHRRYMGTYAPASGIRPSPSSSNAMDTGYKKAIDARQSSNPILATNTPPKRVKGKTESAICLYLALSQTSSGVSYSIDSLRPYAKDADFWNDTLTGDSELEFVDAWAEPLRFYRFAYNNSLLQSKAPASGLRKTVPYKGQSYTLVPLDPIDPKGTLLLDKSGQPWMQMSPAKAALFDNKIHVRRMEEWPTVNTPNSLTYTASWAVPVIVSAGPNTSTDSTPQPAIGFPNGFYGYHMTGLTENIYSLMPNPPKLAPNFQDMGVATPLDEVDNLYTIPLR
jgi:prepilin-type N-terminal cleavage/methylation domain-containing protein